MIFRVLYWVWLASEVLILIVTRTRSGDGKVSDRGSLVLLWVVICAAMFASGWAPSLLPGGDLRHAPWIAPVSLSLLIVGLAIRWTAIVTLGRAFSVNVAIHDDQHVHKTGLFRLVRHPSYLGMMIVFLAVGLRLRNWYSVGIAVLLPLAALLYRMHVEEAALTEAFGEEYVDYSRVTKRLVPYIY